MQGGAAMWVDDPMSCLNLGNDFGESERRPGFGLCSADGSLFVSGAVEGGVKSIKPAPGIKYMSDRQGRVRPAGPGNGGIEPGSRVRAKSGSRSSPYPGQMGTAIRYRAAKLRWEIRWDDGSQSLYDPFNLRNIVTSPFKYRASELDATVALRRRAIKEAATTRWCPGQSRFILTDKKGFYYDEDFGREGTMMDAPVDIEVTLPPAVAAATTHMEFKNSNVLLLKAEQGHVLATVTKNKFLNDFDKWDCFKTGGFVCEVLAERGVKMFRAAIFL